MKVDYEGSFYIKVGRKYLKTDIDTAYIENLQKENAELEKVLSEIENRAQVAMLFNIPPKLDEDTLAAQLKRFNIRGD